MELAKVTNENLIAGLLLRYRKFSSVDLDIYRDILLEKYGYKLSPFAVDIKGIMNYIMKFGDYYYMLDTPEVSSLFKDKQGEVIPNIIENIGLEEVILRKISKLGGIPEYLVPSVFNSEEEYVINELLEDMSIIYVWSNNLEEMNERELQLTSIGMERLQTIKEEYNDKNNIK